MKRLLLFLICIICGCVDKHDTSKNVFDILAEGKGSDLKNVVEFYKNTGDSLKLEAAYFLLQNMPGLGSEHVIIASDSGKINYYDYLSTNSRPDTLNLVYESDFVEDVHQISSEYLIENIEKAFTAWENAPWRNEVKFKDFCEYILPYRFGYELLENWRDSVHYQNTWVLDSIKKSESLKTACTLINNDIRSWFTYVNTQSTSDLLLSYSKLHNVKAGSCLGFTGINAFTMRTFGIPVMVDFVPYWADANGGHSWNSIHIQDSLFGLLWETGLSSTHELFPYDEKGELLHSVFRKSGKVYRKTSQIMENSLAEICANRDNIPPLFRNNRVKDVTQRYLPVSDVRIQLHRKFIQNNYAYICVFNNGQWEGIQWSKISATGYTDFKDMGRDIVYLVSVYEQGKYIPASRPFHLTSEGEIVLLKADTTHLANFIVEKRSHDVYISYPDHKIIPGKSYLLYFWQYDDWKLLEKKEALSRSIVFTKIPSKGLYRLRMYGSGGTERIFLYKDSQQVWM
ncbi:MAG: hypothetical protein ACFB15_00110 [Cyclobacteriaceae bacterium]|mgnify:CR=1 FL=1